MRPEELHAESSGQLMTIEDDLTGLRGDMAEIRQCLDLAEPVTGMKRRVAALQAEVAPPKGVG